MTRCDPARRDERGAFPVDAWTSIADVGAVFDGVELTLGEYERIEAAYVGAFIAFAQESRVDELQVHSLDVGDGLQAGATLSLARAAVVVRRMLREEVICKLESPTDWFALHIGFDLYMYVGSMRPCPSAAQSARRLGLVVEPDWPSPLWPEDDDDS